MQEKIFKGISVSDGIRIANAYIYKKQPHVNVDNNIDEGDIETAIQSLKNAAAQAELEIDALIEHSSQTLANDKIGVFKGHKGILKDPAYYPEIEKLVKNKLFSPQKAVKNVTEKFAQIFEGMKNDYMKERAADVRDVGSRLLNILSGHKDTSLETIKSPVILIADDLSPSDTMQLDKAFVLGFITQRGGKSSHTAIFAKSMGIPALVIPNILDEVNENELIILDGAAGLCIASPKFETQAEYQAKIGAELKEQQILKEYINKPAITKDNIKIVVAANIGGLKDAEYSLQQGAEAVGLFRTEMIYLTKSSLPSEDEQFDEYKKIAQLYGDKEVIVRTLDIGGDKELKYLDIPKEDNPFLGYRAIRLCLNQKEIFLTQLRAILRASAFGKLKIMFPMISGYDELISAKAVLDEAKAQLKSKGVAYDANIKAGIMIEVPSAAFIADTLAKEVDFFSIGTNDLVQYLLAVDRGNEKVSYLYDYFNPAVLKLIKFIAEAAHANNIPVGMCGGMAGDPLAIPFLVGLRLDELSMSAGMIGKAKYIISKIALAECEMLADDVIKCKSNKEIQLLLNNYYKQKIGLF